MKTRLITRNGRKKADLFITVRRESPTIVRFSREILGPGMPFLSGEMVQTKNQRNW
jgi:hypothetical protein